MSVGRICLEGAKVSGEEAQPGPRALSAALYPEPWLPRVIFSFTGPGGSSLGRARWVCPKITAKLPVGLLLVNVWLLPISEKINSEEEGFVLMHGFSPRSASCIAVSLNGVKEESLSPHDGQEAERRTESPGAWEQITLS